MPLGAPQSQRAQVLAANRRRKTLEGHRFGRGRTQPTIQIEWDQTAVAEFKRALALGKRTILRDLGGVHRSAGAVMAREARRRAPRGARRSEESAKYGPLSRARGMAAAGGYDRRRGYVAGVRAAFYYNFVRAGVAGRRLASAGKRPFIEQSILATERDWLQVLAKGIQRLLGKYLNVSVHPQVGRAEFGAGRIGVGRG